MAGRRRPPVLEADTATVASRDEAAEVPAKKKLAMERKKQRKELYKERHRQSSDF
jgi:DNA polymerase phi